LRPRRACAGQDEVEARSVAGQGVFLAVEQDARVRIAGGRLDRSACSLPTGASPST
jgi:hypothetical protein